MVELRLNGKQFRPFLVLQSHNVFWFRLLNQAEPCMDAKFCWSIISLTLSKGAWKKKHMKKKNCERILFFALRNFTKGKIRRWIFHLFFLALVFSVSPTKLNLAVIKITGDFFFANPVFLRKRNSFFLACRRFPQCPKPNPANSMNTKSKMALFFFLSLLRYGLRNRRS